MTDSETREIALEIEQVSGIKAEELIGVGLLHPEDAKRWLVKEKYYEMAKTGMTYTDIKYELSEKYGISVSSIEKLVYRKRRIRGRGD
jgi:hypothetical protein